MMRPFWISSRHTPSTICCQPHEHQHRECIAQRAGNKARLVAPHGTIRLGATCKISESARTEGSLKTLGPCEGGYKSPKRIRK